jgi:predicted DCC family thiol-disulfide oxidoreductase YuxK
MQIVNVSAFYTDSGVYPRSLLVGSFGIIDLHALSGTLGFQIILLILTAIVYVGLLVGFKTKIATFLSWLLLVSIQNRNPLVLQYGDDLLRMLLFWSIFLPIGDYYSIDSFKKNAVRKTYQVFSAGSVAFILQMFILYFFGALLKSGIQWHQEGSAIYYALRLEQDATAFTPILLHVPPLFLILLTHIILLIELLIPFLFFFPVFSEKFRTFAIFVFISLHLGLGIFLKLGTFTWIPIVGLLGMLPLLFWEKVFAFFKKYRPQKLTIYYDDDCGFCNRSVYFIKTIFFLYDVKIFPAQKEPQVHKEMQKHSSWVIKDSKGKLFFKADGFAKILSASPVFFFLSSFLLWKPMNTFANTIYMYTAEHRTLFCTLPQPEKKGLTIVSVSLNFIVFILLCFVLIWNIALLPNVKIITPKMLFSIVKVLHLDQDWGMFAQTPPVDDGWYVVPARLANGAFIDLVTQRPLTWEKPLRISDMFQDQEWHAYMIKLSYEYNRSIRPYFLSFLCNNWNKNHNTSEQAVSVQLYFMQKQLPQPFADINTPVWKNLLLSQQCEL